MRKLTILSVGLAVALGLALTVVGVAPGGAAPAKPPPKPPAASTEITINQFQYAPADAAVKVGQPIKITNNDDVPHTVTANDGSFDVNVPAKGSATVTVPKAGKFPYACTYHPGQHNPASFNAS